MPYAGRLGNRAMRTSSIIGAHRQPRGGHPTDQPRRLGSGSVTAQSDSATRRPTAACATSGFRRSGLGGSLLRLLPLPLGAPDLGLLPGPLPRAREPR